MSSVSAPARVLPALVAAQFLGVSPWFAVNAVMPELQRANGWAAEAVGPLTAAVQLGFIAGTLLFALGAVADRFPARRVFLACALASALCTMAALASADHFEALFAWRALTGFCLAGIYPVGMKIAAQWFPRGLGAALGWLVGALVLGSALPHALRALTVSAGGWPWEAVFVAIAMGSLAAGALVMLAVPEPHHAPARVSTLQWRALGAVWTDRKVRASVLGYFGHMWELYAMWVLLPFIVATRLQGAALSWTAFAALGAGALGCALGGRVAQRVGSARVAGVQLASSGLCCLAAPWMLAAPDAVFYAWLVLWGITVAGDSPQFSALTAVNAPPQAVGSVLTLTNSLGFALSIVSIQLFVSLLPDVPLGALLPWLAAGPLLGLVALRPLLR
ncbi:MFS transporter [Rubrivivax albus]|uniref:MFS transporter n=1 Tax=Rubrivivax albus TaxID=2499835 RepID=A0A3S2X235_9BURK|nr:MFS transporter [Rubrivivax albus]RVT52329.1 MFS transporter [Rubrivivax albus]